MRPSHAPVAQLDRVLPSEGRGRGFESLRAHQNINGLGDHHLTRFCCRVQDYPALKLLVCCVVCPRGSHTTLVWYLHFIV